MDSLTLELNRTPWPADWATVFGRLAPLHIEIGFGNGQFLLAQAQSQPQFNFLGLEIAWPSIIRTERKLRDTRLSNVRLIRGAGQSVLQALCMPGSLCGVTINFPDPWPKAAHAHRRLINETFLELLASRLSNGATLDIATDHADYGSWIANLLQASAHFDSRLDCPYVNEDRDRHRTKYERKGLVAGNTCFYFKWRRNDATVENSFPVPRELPMPHVVVRSPLELDDLVNRFEPKQCATESGTVRLIELYRSSSRPSLIVDTYIAEQPVEQRLMVEIYCRPDGDFLIRLLATGFPRVTESVHAAIDCLARWFCSLHPEAQVVRHNLRL